MIHQGKGGVERVLGSSPGELWITSFLNLLHIVKAKMTQQTR